MGQVLGFSHCKEFGSVSSTPDSTPPCTDGGNEESDFPELQTAREWSEDEEGPEDDDGGLSSPSIWGTPRQNSFELTFSYIAFSEGEGSSRRDSGRRRTGGRGRRSSLHRTDTAETLLTLDSPTVEWDPHAFLAGEEEQEVDQPVALLPAPVENLPWTLESSVQGIGDFPEKDTGTTGEAEEIPDSQIHSETYSIQAQIHGSGPLVTMETIAPSQTEEVSCATPPPIGHNTREEVSSDHCSSTISQSERPTIHIRIAVLDLIYWKDCERTGMVFTGLVVGLLSLFQLSIITVLSTLSLGVMCFTISVRIYYKLLNALQLRDSEHPFKSYLEKDIGLHGEQAEHYMQRIIVLTFSALDTLKRLVFVGNLFESLKFLLLMYLVTYLGALCNGLTLLIIGVITVFSFPLFYRQHQEKVDNLFAAVQAHIDNLKDFLNRLAQGGGPTPDSTPGGAKPTSK